MSESHETGGAVAGEIRSVTAASLRTNWHRLLTEVAERDLRLVVTKRGQPVVMIVPIPNNVSSLQGSVSLLAVDDEAYFSTGDFVSP